MCLWVFACWCSGVASRRFAVEGRGVVSIVWRAVGGGWCVFGWYAALACVRVCVRARARGCARVALVPESLLLERGFARRRWAPAAAQQCVCWWLGPCGVYGYGLAAAWVGPWLCGHRPLTLGGAWQRAGRARAGSLERLCAVWRATAFQSGLLVAGPWGCGRAWLMARALRLRRERYEPPVANGWALALTACCVRLARREVD